MLRTRLFLSLIPFVVTLLATGVCAVVLFSRLSNDVESAVLRSYQSTMAAQAMSVALSRMEAGLRLALSGAKDSSSSYFNDNAAVFEQNLAGELDKTGPAPEGTLLRQLQTDYDSFHKAGVAILGSNQRLEQRRIFEEDVVPNLLAMNLVLERVRETNHQNILATSQNIRRINHDVTRLMVVGMMIALLITAGACLSLGKSILKPIRSLTRATREIGQGNLDQVIPVVSRDELGELAEAFNNMAAQLKAYRQSTTEKIMRLHRTMEATLASFRDPIFVLDWEGRVALKNPAAEELSEGFGVNDALPARLARTASDVLHTGKDFLPYSFKEVLSFRVAGEEHFYLPRIHAMHGEEHKPVGVAVVLQDVTRFRMLDDAKTNLVATASHEMKTPLTSILMVLHVLLEKGLGTLNPRQTDLVQTARKDAERLVRILNDFLDLARLEAGKSGLNKQRVEPARLVQDIIEEARQSALHPGLTIWCSVEPGLPDLFVDPQRIGHVFHNFIMNAIQHSPPGGEIQIRAARADDGGVRFSVKDQGLGIPEEFQGRLFERFFRVPGQAKSGAGLGLSIAREIIVAHGGRIGVHSRPGHGSEFYVVLSSASDETAGGIPPASSSLAE